MKVEPKTAGKDLNDNVPRMPVKIAPADASAIVDARIEDVISSVSQGRDSRLLIQGPSAKELI